MKTRQGKREVWMQDAQEPKGESVSPSADSQLKVGR